MYKDKIHRYQIRFIPGMLGIFYINVIYYINFKGGKENPMIISIFLKKYLINLTTFQKLKKHLAKQ